MMKQIINKTFFLLFIVLISLFTACRDELLFEASGVPEEGLPATVSFKVDINGEITGTRYAGFIPGDQATSRIGHLWIGIFNVGTGNLIKQLELDESEIQESQNSNGKITIENLPLSSGTCYIVGVSNSNSNQGVIIEDSGSKSDSKANLLTILRGVTTWDEFKKISFLLSNPESVSRVSGNFLMSGSYCKETDLHSRDALWDEEGNPVPVYIYPDNNELSGSICLRRLDSYVKFILQAGDNIQITPVSWQVKNIPGTSFLYERKGSCEYNQEELINAADAEKNGIYWDNYGSFNNFYNNSQVYLANTFSKDRNEDYSLTGTYSFDFYQLENKHRGIISSENSKLNGNNIYNEREREIKNDNGENTGWYSSLVRSAGEETPTSEKSYRNNNASFVEIRVQVEYDYVKGDESFNPVNPGDYPPETLVHRVANAVYTVHLGYVKYDNNQADVNDFNCYRNTSTTYTITILGADNIRYEAVKNSEIESGAEGTVTDIDENMINMDCHYGVFNIKLSDNARRDLIWRIRAPYGEHYVDMACGNSLEEYSSPNIINLSDGNHNEEIKALSYNQFYNWVQIVPTERDVIASYPGDPRLINRTNLPSGYLTDEIKDGLEGVWYLENLRDPDNFPHPSKKDNPGEDEEFYYTVFIDEYVYEHEYSPEDESMTGTAVVYNNWGNYVNRDYRKLWIRLGAPYISKDGESIYSESQYMLTQESIQTFYSNNAEIQSCFGIEHINETYNGKAYDSNLKVYESQNGRKNLQSFRNDFFNSKESLGSLLGNRFQIGKKSGSSADSPDVTFYINEHDHAYMTGALARNRDLNNNGIIDDFEIRWYLPVVKTYTRMQLGAVSLKTPLFNLHDYATNEITPGFGTIYSHYAASDNSMLWAEELISIGVINMYGSFAGTMRCIRNLGENPGDEIKDSNENIETAYEYDRDSRIVTMKYYRSAALRPETQNFIPCHFTGEILSYPSRNFKVAKFNITPSNIGNEEIFKDSEDKVHEDGGIYKAYRTDDHQPISEMLELWEKWFNENTLGKDYSEEENGADKGTWRVPNINELAILSFLNVLEHKSYISCTREYFSGRQHFFLGRNPAGGIVTEFSDPYYVILVKDIIP